MSVSNVKHHIAFNTLKSFIFIYLDYFYLSKSDRRGRSRLSLSSKVITTHDRPTACRRNPPIASNCADLALSLHPFSWEMESCSVAAPIHTALVHIFHYFDSETSVKHNDCRLKLNAAVSLCPLMQTPPSVKEQRTISTAEQLILIQRKGLV